MRATLVVSTLAILSAIPTASAQNFPTSYGNSSVTISTTEPVAGPLAPSDRAYAPDRAYVPRPHRARTVSHR